MICENWDIYLGVGIAIGGLLSFIFTQIALFYKNKRNQRK